MADASARFLGFAFACADMVFELDSNGEITFALGATNHLLGADPDRLAGQSWRSFISDDDSDARISRV